MIWIQIVLVAATLVFQAMYLFRLRWWRRQIERDERKLKEEM